MLKIIGIIAVIVVVFIVAVLAYATTKPDTFRVRREIAIIAPPEKIFPLINDFKNWGSWSPYENKDPNMKRTYGSATSGKGALYAWDGDKNIGKGSMEITESSPSSKVALKLDFTSPFEAHNMVEFTLQPQGNSNVTKVSWDMHGPAPFMAKVMHVFINMDRMVGTDFEVGLANLKTLAEK
jgi:hypothetical protein